LLALPATSSLIFPPADSPGRISVIARIWQWMVFWTARLILNTLRSIPELVWVLVCILAVGIGPFAGTIAIGLHTAGVLGKLYAETMEEAPRRPIDALRSTGASPLQILLWGVWPQAKPLLGSYTVLRWEMNLRASTILGLVGGGGLGQAIYNNVQLGFYPRVATLVIIIYLLVISSDLLSDRLRGRTATAQELYEG
jgi:phosphonate transport system permease protein